MEIIDGKLTYISPNIHNIPKDCGFDDLHISPAKLAKMTQDERKQFLFMEERLRRNGLKIGKSEWKDGKRQVFVNTSQSAEKIQQLLPFPQRIFYQIETRNLFNPGKNLIFELTLFEFSRQKARRLGLKWPQSVSVYSINNVGERSLNLQDLTSDAAKEIIIQSDFGESQGVGKILAQPTLRTQPGIESRFLSGGEFPIKNSNAFQSQTSWKSYGLKVALTPSKESEVGDTEVALDFKLEFSEPNMEHAVEGIPSLIQRQLESRFDLRTNETTVLTSMITLREGKGRSGIAFLSQIPILGLLAGQDSRLKTDSELWFAVKPSWEEIPMKAAHRKANFGYSL